MNRSSLLGWKQSHFVAPGVLAMREIKTASNSRKTSWSQSELPESVHVAMVLFGGIEIIGHEKSLRKLFESSGAVQTINRNDSLWIKILDAFSTLENDELVTSFD